MNKSVMPPSYFGVWEPAGDRLCLRPSHAPWRGLFADLDSIADHTETNAEPVSVLEEAEAIVACCLRYGSFFSALCQGERWKGEKGGAVSLIRDSEMMRINIEFSAGLAQWFEDSDRNRDTVVRRTRAARSHLDMNWGTKTSGRDFFRFRCYGGGEDGIDESARTEFKDAVTKKLEELAGKAGGWEGMRDALRVPQEYTSRKEANYFVVKCYRNGPVESLHAGRSNGMTDTYGYRRLSNPEIREVCNSTVLKLCDQLIIREDFDRDPRNVMRRADFWNNPHGWSETEETSPTWYIGKL